LRQCGFSLHWLGRSKKPQYCLCSIQKYYYASNFVPLRLLMTNIAVAMAISVLQILSLCSAFCQMSYAVLRRTSRPSTTCLLSAQNSFQRSYFFLLRLASVVLNGLYKCRRYSLPLEDDTEFSRGHSIQVSNILLLRSQHTPNPQL
jgi:hypothetical protein